MDRVRLGIVGVGTMGSMHAQYLLAGKIERVDLVAVADIDPSALERFPSLLRFNTAAEMIRSGAVDAIIIATPHYFHTTIGIDALQNGLHVLVEKPISVHKADCERLIAAHTNKKQVFAAMFNQRTDPRFKAIKKMIDDGELGPIARVNWIITDWFRPEAYYASGSWRATWKGEGGGVLLNQCPHNLDLLQWMTGLPVSVRGYCNLGKYHNIEVDDEVTAYFEYANGATGVFITSTGEAPGTNRLEICGDRGKIVVEGDKVTFTRTDVSTREFRETSQERFARPPMSVSELPVQGRGGQHAEVTQNFVDAILDGTPLIAPAEDGIRSVELANAMLFSSAQGKAVSLPLDGPAYEEFLHGLIRDSKLEKKTAASSAPVDMTKSFGT
jgi:predicted dehydrogenase